MSVVQGQMLDFQESWGQDEVSGECQSLAAEAVSAELSPAGGGLQGSKVDQKKLTPAPSKVQSLCGPAIGRPLDCPACLGSLGPDYY